MTLGTLYNLMMMWHQAPSTLSNYINRFSSGWSVLNLVFQCHFVAGHLYLLFPSIFPSFWAFYRGLGFHGRVIWIWSFLLQMTSLDWFVWQSTTLFPGLSMIFSRVFFQYQSSKMSRDFLSCFFRSRFHFHTKTQGIPWLALFWLLSI